MPARSSIVTLPTEVKEWLDKSLVDGNFSGYEALAEAIQAKGYSISKSSLHRYGKNFEDTLAAVKMATEQAKVLVDACPDEQGNLNDALIRLVQQKAFQVLNKLDADKCDLDLDDLGHMIGSLSKASTTVKKYAADVKKRTVEAAKDVETVAKKGGLTDEAVQAIRSKILGIAG
ncbi:MAG: terminase [Candidatus Riflebacteria bacterium HGW-Riflebacteria-1]|jgi:pyruvate formate-lyase activating enzyme-like uncharacterized protein|nr:MAG: terminase [Candidatus Riflebacteria bacterium HGW-Riflebacteria-1]